MDVLSGQLDHLGHDQPESHGADEDCQRDLQRFKQTVIAFCYSEQRKPDRCKKLICKCRNTPLFMDKTSMNSMSLDLTSNEV
jgi:hypothetical protein